MPGLWSRPNENLLLANSGFVANSIPEMQFVQHEGAGVMQGR